MCASGALEARRSLITLYDATNPVSGICVALARFPRELKEIRLLGLNMRHAGNFEREAAFPFVWIICGTVTIPIRWHQNGRRIWSLPTVTLHYRKLFGDTQLVYLLMFLEKSASRHAKQSIPDPDISSCKTLASALHLLTFKWMLC